MNPRRALVRKIVYVVLIAVLLVPVYTLSRPSSGAEGGKQGDPGGKLARLRDEHKLGQASLGDIDPAGATIRLVTLGMRGIAADILWYQANKYNVKKDFTNVSATCEQIVKLEPNFIKVWEFQAHNLSYNLSVQFDDYHDRYEWVIRGIKFLQEGIRINNRAPILQWNLGKFISQKIGKADETKQYRRLFKADPESYGPGDRRADHDNWLVGGDWFREAERVVDDYGAKMIGQAALLYRSEAPMCLMKYAEAIEAEGTFGETAKRAWLHAATDWDHFGKRPIPTTYDKDIRLGELELFMKLSLQASQDLETLEPGLRDKIHKEKVAKLPEAELTAYAMPADKLTMKQRSLAISAAQHSVVNADEVAERIKGSSHKRAVELAAKIADADRMAFIIGQQRDILNFAYWERHSLTEQDDDLLAAHEAIYAGDQAFADGDLKPAKEAYGKGFDAWRKVLDKRTGHWMLDDHLSIDNLMDIIKAYKRILDKSDEQFPAGGFILEDVIKRSQEGVR